MRRLLHSLRYIKAAWFIDIKQIMVYPVTFWSAFLSSPLWAVTQIAFIETIFLQTDSFLGYTKFDNYILYGTYKVTQSLGYLFFFVKLYELRFSIKGEGNESFDYVLIKPIDAQLYSTVGKLWISAWSSIIVGVIMVWYGVSHGSYTFSLFQIGMYGMHILFGMIMMYFIYLVVQMLMFWLEDLQAGDSIYYSLHEFAKYPYQLYQGYFGIFINILFPITLLGSIPSAFLLGRIPPYMVVVYMVMMVVLFLVTRMLWKVSVKRYSSSSS